MDPSDKYEENRAVEMATVESKLPLNEQDKAIAVLGEVIAVLTDRLAPVLTPVPETTGKNGGNPPDVTSASVAASSPLANTLQDNNDRIRRITNRATSLIERLEV